MELLTQRQTKKKNAKLTAQTFDRALGKIGKGGICCEYSALDNRGNFRSPSFASIDNYNRE